MDSVHVSKISEMEIEDNVGHKASRSSRMSKFRQFFATVCLGGISLGASIAWTSPVLPQLEDKNSTTPFHITHEESSWIGSVLAIGALSAALPAGYLADRFGRKKCIIALVIPVAIFTILVIIAKDFYTLCIARLFYGFATGGVCVVAPMYISEISDVSLRGTLGSFFELLIYVGIVSAQVLGAYLDYVLFTVILGVLALLLAVFFQFLPESPAHLMKVNNRDKAERALLFYRDGKYDPTNDLDDIKEEINKAMKINASFKDLLKSKATIRGLVASVGLTAFQQLSAIDGITFYTVEIFQAAGASLGAYTSSIIVAGVELLSAFVVVFLIEKANRRTFLYISAIGTFVCLGVLGMYFHLKLYDITFPGFGLLPISSLVCYIFFFALGLGPVPWMVNGELFAAEVKGSANGITITTNWTLLFVVTKTLPMMMDGFGPHITFYIFSGFMVLCVVFIRFFVPETRGKTLQEIQNELNL